MAPASSPTPKLEREVLDFGIARVHESSTQPSLTRTGKTMGTPAFMPPEQTLGRRDEVNARSDLWAVGATMFTLLSGKHVHEGATPEELMILSATRPARSLHDVATGVPVPICAVIDRALSFANHDRWPSASAMADALSEAAGAFAPTHPPPPPKFTTAVLVPPILMPPEPEAEPAPSEPEESSVPHAPSTAAVTSDSFTIGKPARPWRRFAAIGVGVVAIGVAAFAALSRGDKPVAAPATTARAIERENVAPVGSPPATTATPTTTAAASSAAGLPALPAAGSTSITRPPRPATLPATSRPASSSTRPPPTPPNDDLYKP